MRIALATCRHPTEHDSDADFLAPALRRRGAEVEAQAWNAAGVDWAGYDLVLVNSTWDYHEQVEAFRAWLSAVAASTRLCNPLELINWNLDKRYLRELAEGGVATIPTIWTEPGETDVVVRAVAERGWDDIVIKPVIDLGANQLARVEPQHVAQILGNLDQPGMAQPFISSLEREGEISVLFVEGVPAHALRKLPARGDFRVQPEYGGTHEAIEAPAAAIEIGERAIAAAPGKPLYARVDLVRGDDGGLMLIELELIEPHFYLDVAPASAELIARALLAAASG